MAYSDPEAPCLRRACSAERVDERHSAADRAPFAAGLLDHALADGFDPIPPSPAAALMDRDHRDPFDRMIAAVAQAEELPIVSSDVVFDVICAPRVWD